MKNQSCTYETDNETLNSQLYAISQYKPYLPEHYKQPFEAAKEERFKLLIKEPIRLSDGEEFIYCYSFKRDRERYRHTWHREYPFRRQRHLAKVGRSSSDTAVKKITDDFPKAKEGDDKLQTRTVPEYPQIEMIVYVHDTVGCEKALHNYLRLYQYLGGAGYEFFETNGLEVLKFCKLWTKDKKRAEDLGGERDEMSSKRKL